VTKSVYPNYKTLIAQKSSYLFFGRALPVLVLFLITIIYSRRLSYEEYGKFQSVWIYTNIVNVLISFSITSILLSSSLSGLFDFVRSNKKIVAGFYVTLSIVTLTLFFFYAKNFIASTKWLLIVFIIIQNITTVAETLLIKNHNEKISLIINLFYSLFFFVWHYFVLLNTYSLNNLISGIIVITFIKCIIIFFIKQEKDHQVTITYDKFFFRHWAYLGVNDIVGVVARWIDKIFLLYLLSPGDFALFFNGSFEIPLFGVMVGVVGSIMLIEISKNISFTENIVSLFNNSFFLLSGIVFPLFFFLLFYNAELFSLVFKDKYNASIPIFIISIFILPVRINTYSVILQCYSRGDKIMFGSIMDLCIAILLMLILYPLMGTRGIALSIVISTYCQAFYYLFQSARVINKTIFDLVPVKFLVLNFSILLVIFAVVYFSLRQTGRYVNLGAGLLVMITSIIFEVLYFLKRNLHYGIVEKT
jgi:O-antigen/teichoic acid export membrane protein